jgi:hypothetical protein
LFSSIFYAPAEFMADLGRFHKEKGVKRANVLAESIYVQKARAHVDQAFPGKAARHGLAPYRVRKYMNAHAKLGGPVNESVYQIAVALNSTVDGVPFIGSGGKVIVHMNAAGDVLGHESLLRELKGIRKTVTGSTLRSPGEARAEVEARLSARGVDLSRYRLVREEFGYLAKGRNSGQTVLAPHYVYVFEPEPGIIGRKLVEVTPAVTDVETLALIDADERREAARKAEMLKNVPPPSRKE